MTRPALRQSSPCRCPPRFGRKSLDSSDCIQLFSSHHLILPGPTINNGYTMVYHGLSMFITMVYPTLRFWSMACCIAVTHHSWQMCAGTLWFAPSMSGYANCDLGLWLFDTLTLRGFPRACGFLWEDPWPPTTAPGGPFSLCTFITLQLWCSCLCP